MSPVPETDKKIIKKISNSIALSKKFIQYASEKTLDSREKRELEEEINKETDPIKREKLHKILDDIKNEKNKDQRLKNVLKIRGGKKTRRKRRTRKNKTLSIPLL